MSNTRLTVVVRKDLKMPEGLLAAQCTHMAMEFIRNKIDSKNKMSPLNNIEKEWVKDPYISILAVDTYEDLNKICKMANDNEYTWTDTIPSPTFENEFMTAFVGVAIGPADFDKIKVVTGSLQPY